ncbi:hypothetical protein PAHAL_2G148600 [Panicum hallii]|uniref:TF-B3 domain-containing protein n=1 Tax=Panicum hallii TaxID=206008 RepID=A0A2S3GYN1_9POAL|nr:hypothetical protein PAHAL_2G148600 [Panicum hallii]
MGIDQPIKRKRGRPAGSRHPNTQMEQKMALVKQRMALLDSGGGDSDKDDDYHPMDDELSVVVAHQPVVIPCGDTDDDGVDDNWESAMSRGQEIQANLPVGHPSSVKRMLQSHVVRGFWLGLPKDFSQKHLPKKEAGIVLEDEHGEDHHTTYFYYKQGLSAGWRGFAIDHDIKVGDVVVFELVKPTKFKVYIVRANEFTTTDVDLNLLNLGASKKEKQSKEESSEDVITDEDAKVGTPYREVPPSDGSTTDGIGLDSDIDFDDVTSFSNVNLILDCLATDCGFHDHLRRIYYELCCSRRSLLHKNLLRQLHPTLVAGVIVETVSIAEGIRACKAQSSSREDLLNRKKTLESFELLGMNVAFLLKRVNELLATRSGESSEWQEKYKELKLERACAGEKMKVLELQLSNVKDVMQKVDVEMVELESSLKKSDEALQELASAPW